MNRLIWLLITVVGGGEYIIDFKYKYELLSTRIAHAHA